MFIKTIVAFARFFILTYATQLSFSCDSDLSHFSEKRSVVSSPQSFSQLMSLTDDLKIKILSHFIENEETTTHMDSKEVSSICSSNKELNRIVKKHIYSFKLKKRYSLYESCH